MPQNWKFSIYGALSPRDALGITKRLVLRTPHLRLETGASAGQHVTKVTSASWRWSSIQTKSPWGVNRVSPSPVSSVKRVKP